MEKIFIISNRDDLASNGEPPCWATYITEGPGLLHALRQASSPNDTITITSKAAAVPQDAVLQIAKLPFKGALRMPQAEIPQVIISQYIALVEAVDTLPGTITTSYELLTSIQSAYSYTELVLKLMVSALVQGLTIDEEGSEEGAIQDIPNISRAGAIRQLLETSNIEDLFPNLPWTENSSASAAASYQTLAAMFVRLGDNLSARECLNCSEKFDSSPRSLALKAMISKANGETLGAVADMVSSLQQYEVRRVNSTPATSANIRNIEIINSHLVEGLEALQKQDNETALEKFSAAVFAFDPFYEAVGLSTRKGSAN